MFITFALDILIMNSITNKLKPFDFYYAFSILIIHGIFINALFLCSQKVLDILHYSVFIYIAFSPFLSNKYLIGANLLLLFLIQLLWILKGCCILNDQENPLRFGFSIELSIFTLIYTIIVANKLPKLSMKNYNKKKLKIRKSKSKGKSKKKLKIRKSKKKLKIRKSKSKNENAVTQSIFSTFA